MSCFLVKIWSNPALKSPLVALLSLLVVGTLVHLVGPTGKVTLTTEQLSVGSLSILAVMVALLGIAYSYYSRFETLKKKSDEVQPADTCLYCRRATGQQIDHLAPGNLTQDWAGREAYIFKCDNPQCGKTYGRQVQPPA